MGNNNPPKADILANLEQMQIELEEKLKLQLATTLKPETTALASAGDTSNLPLIIGLVLLILGIIILGWFLYNKNKKETKPKEETTPLKNLENQRQMGSNMPATDKQ